MGRDYRLRKRERGRGEEGKRGRGEEGKRGRGEEGKRGRGSRRETLSPLLLFASAPFSPVHVFRYPVLFSIRNGGRSLDRLSLPGGPERNTLSTPLRPATRGFPQTSADHERQYRITNSPSALSQGTRRLTRLLLRCQSSTFLA